MQPEEQNQKQQNENTEEIVRDSASEPETVSGLGIVQCPECSSTRICKHSSLGLFLVAAAGFAVLLLLRNILVLLPLKNFMFILSFAVMFLICAACTYIWMQLFQSSLCKDCGHRFPIRLDIKQERDKIPFPIGFSILTYILFLLSGVTSAEIIEELHHGSFSYFLFIGVIAAFAYSFIGALSVLYHVIIYFLFRKDIRNQIVWAGLFIMPVFLIGGYNLYNSLPRVRIAKIFSYARFADLPELASDIKIYGWSSLFSGESYVRFEASLEDIDEFINDSPSIKDQDCIKYSRERMRLVEPRDRDKRMEYEQAGHELFYPPPMAPDWYRPEIRGRGRGYGVPPFEDFNYDEVIVDDENNIVYIRIIWS